MSIPANVRNGIYGLLGRGIGHSMSPAIFRRVFDTLRWPAVYTLCDLPPGRVCSFLHAGADAGFVGLNVTTPYKTRVINDLDELDSSAADVGAVNTVAVRGRRLVGYNTDVAGVVAALRPHRATLRGGSAVILGAGGAARAVLSTLLGNFCMQRVTLVARRPQQARQVVKHVKTRVSRSAIDVIPWRPEGIAARLDSAALVVNATPLGGGDHWRLSPLPDGVAISPATVVFDLVYRPRRTRLLRQAQRSGCQRLVGGWPMLVAQAEASFTVWTKRRFPAVVRRRLLDMGESL
ncbi:MAG: shikimate dehydrogenase [Candidatus Zixiibacteriota bacterium]